MNSAIATPSASGFDAELCWKRAVIDSGEFIVIVVAVKTTSHDQRLSLLASASRSILLKTSLMRGGAGVGSGRASAAVVTDLSVDDSFIAMCEGGQVEEGVWASKRKEHTFPSPPKLGAYLYSYRYPSIGAQINVLTDKFDSIRAGPKEVS